MVRQAKPKPTKAKPAPKTPSPKPASEKAPLPEKIAVSSYEQQPIAITPVEYGALQDAFNFFRDKLFGEQLPDTFIVYSRHPHSYGHYAHERYVSRDGQTKRSELSLNPDAFIGRTNEDILSTLVHEQTHLWQYTHGKPSHGYHNTEFGGKLDRSA
jgi:SprT-like family